MTARTLRTERLHLRPCERSDVDALLALFLEPDVRRFLLDDRPVERSFVEDLVERSLRNFETRGFGHFVVAESEGGPLVGCVGLAPVDEEDEVEVLYALARERWGGGLAAEATRAVLAFGFSACGLERILARVDVPNLASRRLAERLGMRSLGERPVAGTPLAHYVLERPEPA